MRIHTLKDKYIRDLESNILSYWNKAIDETYGGVFTCYTNKGDKKVSDRKYIWSQGRFLWVCSNLQMLVNQGTVNLPDNWERWADHTYQFLKDYALIENNQVVFAVERDGSKIKDQINISIFADCFYLLGCNSYAQLKKDKEIFEENLIIYSSIKNRIDKNQFNSAPYPIPTGYSSHSIPMILLNTTQELYETALILDHKIKKNLLKDMKKLIDQILNEFKAEKRIFEMVSIQPEHDQTLLSRHLNPGHTLESIWFMIHSVPYFNVNTFEEFIPSMEQLAEHILTVGWDEEYGGLFRYIDKNGGRPQGEKGHSAFEQLVIETWDLKLWWPHSEALYTTLLLYDQTKNEKWLKWYKKVERYTFNTFPNEDQTIGEWIQIRTRKGDPLEKVVALPVKDPFHIVRSYILMIKLLKNIGI